MQNLALFTGFSTSQVVSRISEPLTVGGCFFFQGEYETYVAKNHWIFYCLFGALGFPCSSIWLSHLAPREATLQENEESVFSQGIYFSWGGGGGKGLWERLWETCFWCVFVFFVEFFFVATYNCFGFAFFFGFGMFHTWYGRAFPWVTRTDWDATTPFPASVENEGLVQNPPTKK